jgi:hypothetical protein
MALGFNSSPKKREAMAMVKRKRQKDKKTKRQKDNTDRAQGSRAKESE